MWSRLLRGKKRSKAPSRAPKQEPSRLSNEEVRSLVTALYRGFLDRDPEPKGLQSWMQQIEHGAFDTRLLETVPPVSGIRRQGSGRAGYGRHLPWTGILPDVARIPSGRSRSSTWARKCTSHKDHVYARLLDFIPCRMIGFEPLDERRREREDAESGADLSMRPEFIGDGQTHVFNINEPDVTSSLLPLNDEVTGQLDAVEPRQDRAAGPAPILSRSTTRSMRSNAWTSCNLDIQGFEHAALAGAPSVLARTLAVHCEVEFIELYRANRCLRRSTCCCERPGSGFRGFRQSDPLRLRHRRRPTSADQVAWADAIYFKDRDLVSDPADLLVQALIAAAVYRKTSFARWLAGAYDARTGLSTSGLFG